jgi:hypothetical protein
MVSIKYRSSVFLLFIRQVPGSIFGFPPSTVILEWTMNATLFKLLYPVLSYNSTLTTNAFEKESLNKLNVDQPSIQAAIMRLPPLSFYSVFLSFDALKIVLHFYYWNQMHETFKNRSTHLGRLLVTPKHFPCDVLAVHKLYANIE